MRNEETRIQRLIQHRIGALPDVYLMRNSVGLATHEQLIGDQVVQRKVPYGLEVGSPDLVAILSVRTSNGRVVGLWFCLEVKKPGEKPTKEQRECHERWRKFGAFVETVTNEDEAVAALERARAWGREAVR